MEQITEKQHFVPKFYLKRFAEPQGFLQVFDVKKRALLPQRPYGGVCYSSFFYAAKTGKADEMAQLIETWLGEIENYIATRLPPIIEKLLNYDHIDEDDRYTVAVLLSMLWLRTPGMREQLNRMEEQFTKKIMGVNPEVMVDKYIAETGRVMSAEQRNLLIETYKEGRYKMTFSNVQHIRFMVDALGFGEKGFANMFYGEKWKVYIAKGNERFITSGNPVVEWFRPPVGFYGRSFLDRTHYLALTPEIMIELTYPRGSTKVKRKTLFADQNVLVRMLNIVIAAHAPEHAYSGEKARLQILLDGLTAASEAERMYWNQFERPWEEHNEKVATQATRSTMPPASM